jgi:hypothetical protein
MTNEHSDLDTNRHLVLAHRYCNRAPHGDPNDVRDYVFRRTCQRLLL